MESNGTDSKKKICGAKTRSGGICKSRPMPNGRCRLHGGKSLGGLASPRLKTGRYSKFLPARLQDKYLEARSDPELLNLSDEIGLLDARLEDLLHRVDSGESGETWKRTQETYEDLADAIKSQNAIAMGAALSALERLIKKGLADFHNWQEIEITVEQRRKLVETERKRRIDMNQMITAERAMLLIGAISDIIRRNVADRKVLNNISLEMAALLRVGQKQGEPAEIEG